MKHAPIFLICWMLILGGCAHGADFPLIARAPDGWQTKDIAKVHWNDQGNTLTIEGDTRSSHTATLSLSATTATLKTIDGVTTINGAAYPPAAPTPAPGSISHGDLANLNADDHPQYHNDARALTWLGTRSTSDLPEGSNLYFSDARVRAALSAVSPLAFNALTGAISITTASATTSGALSKGDWSIFNGKEPAIAAGTTAQYWRGDKTWQTLPTGSGITTASADTRYVPLARTIITNAPLTGGGALSGNLTLGIPQAGSGQSGYLSSSDYDRAAWLDESNGFTEVNNFSPMVSADHAVQMDTASIPGGDSGTTVALVTSLHGAGQQITVIDGTLGMLIEMLNGSGTVLKLRSNTGKLLEGYRSPGRTKVLDISANGAIDALGAITGSNLSGTNTGDVTLTGTPDYITISGQTITRGLIDLATDVTGQLPNANMANMAAKTVKGNGNVSAAAPTDLSASAVLDMIGVSRGAIVTRGSSTWGQLPPSSTIGLPLVSKGTSADIAYDYLNLATAATGTLPMANGGTGLGGVQSAVSNVSMLAFIPYETSPPKDYVTGTNPGTDYSVLGGMVTDGNGRQSIGQCCASVSTGGGAAIWYNKFNVGTANFTVSAWARTTNTVGVVVVKRAASHDGYICYLASGKPAAGIYYNGGTAIESGAIGSGTINDGNWHLLTWVFNRAGNVTAYVDAVSAGTYSISAGSAYTLTDASSNFWTGSNYTGGSVFTGNLDEIMIWNRALPVSEIRALYLMTTQFRIMTY